MAGVKLIFCITVYVLVSESRSFLLFSVTNDHAVHHVKLNFISNGSLFIHQRKKEYLFISCQTIALIAIFASKKNLTLELRINTPKGIDSYNTGRDRSAFIACIGN